ncbi:DNA polymerase-3 subunit beta [Amycolatopsis arida]|uniref:DNA polymerase-3 subunit beta n=1 Tax=Amycolatopsis arida TaxID=587909 RepID=A0A1I5P8W6_9PSEU|nr:DNA polymerase III subunit beta [Amycolatopsis arida]TDX98408.1 DNA polymerase-3 subunit beta [Amycolatopsis arida]SFP30554.1 DNA polymerase-3 subunit beta [Amycolatopsis arida]
MDLTATTATLATTTAQVAALLPGRVPNPVLGGVLLTADAHGVVLAGSDREHGLRLTRTALVHAEGRALVAAKPLAETLRALDADQVRLVVEGPRLAVRTPTARFALPLLDTDAHPGVPAPPPVTGSVRGEAWRRAVLAVAPTASRDGTLPIFTGLRLWAEGDRLVLLATDRYRMAMAELPWRPEPNASRLDLLAPAGVLADVAKQVGRGETVALHADPDRVGLTWATDSFSTALLAMPFPDDRARRLLESVVAGTADVDADTVAAAVRRAAPYGGPHGTVTLAAADGELRVRGNDPQAGESEETVKATVSGHHGTTVYQARYLLDALRPFAGRSVRMGFQEGLRPTVLTAGPDEDEVDLTYLVVPMRPPGE